MSAILKNSIRPDWSEIEEARSEIIKFLSSLESNERVIDAVIMIAGELLENAIKYGSFTGNEDTIIYSIKTGKENITIEAKSPIGDIDDDHLKNLDKTVQWIRGFQNPFEAYVEKLKEVSAKPFEDSESGLGLVRIAYEGQSIIDFYVNEENIISVSAVYYL